MTYGTVGFDGGGWVAFVCIVAVLLWLMISRNQVVCWCREFVVTNKRILIKAGILSRETRESRFEKVESCDVSQGVWGRLLGYASIVVRGVGGSGIIEHYVKDPLSFRQFIIDKISGEKN